ncbi:MAG: DNA polymerase III subunit epsilon [Alphaproteobacteria bacterium]|nr:DNA polymerase III subunit epsilon [Alphaproteobacteria bacterium]
MNPIYVVTDVEVDGPTPGENSMLSFASVAVDEQAQEVDEFEAVLDRLDGATSDAITMAWFRSQPEVLAAATLNPKPASDVITLFVNWVRMLPGYPVFVAHPISLDGPWLDFYLRKFAGIRLLKGPWVGERLFYEGGMCLRSYASGKLGWPLSKCDPEHYPPEWMGYQPHSHCAIDDARGYAKLLATLMTRS